VIARQKKSVLFALISVREGFTQFLRVIVRLVRLKENQNCIGPPCPISFKRKKTMGRVFILSLHLRISKIRAARWKSFFTFSLFPFFSKKIQIFIKKIFQNVKILSKIKKWYSYNSKISISSWYLKKISKTKYDNISKTKSNNISKTKYDDISKID
jgi:hypothetical protein